MLVIKSGSGVDGGGLPSEITGRKKPRFPDLRGMFSFITQMKGFDIFSVNENKSKLDLPAYI